MSDGLLAIIFPKDALRKLGDLRKASKINRGLMAVGVPPNAHVHAISFATIEGACCGMWVITSFCIGIAKLLNKLTIGRINVGIIALMNRH